MTPEKIQELIQEALYNEDNDVQDIASIDTFRDASLMTDDKGLVIALEDGSEFQVTIVQTRLERN